MRISHSLQQPGTARKQTVAMMMRLACILIAFALVGTYADEPEKLVNGVPTSVEAYPFVISMRMQNNHMCGGALISEYYVLTAGHCVEPFITEPYLRAYLTVVTGTTYLNTGGESHQVESLTHHENYQANPMGKPYGFDIGIIKLTKPVKFNPRQQPIRLPSTDVARNDPVTVVAWGKSGAKNAVHNNLQKLDARCMPANECQLYHQNFMSIHRNEFCTLISYGTGTCNGDSGSSVIRQTDRTLVGLVSGGRPCALGVPDIYTTVYPYLDWIKRQMLR